MTFTKQEQLPMVRILINPSLPEFMNFKLCGAGPFSGKSKVWDFLWAIHSASETPTCDSRTSECWLEPQGPYQMVKPAIRKTRQTECTEQNKCKVASLLERGRPRKSREKTVFLLYCFLFFFLIFVFSLQQLESMADCTSPYFAIR